LNNKYILEQVVRHWTTVVTRDFTTVRKLCSVFIFIYLHSVNPYKVR